LPKNLVIVESPAKAKTIERYMGKDYRVLASMGHVRDLPKSDFGIEVNGGVKLSYKALEQANSKKAVTAIRKALKDAETVWLAPDPDREGEAIAWHIAELVKLKPESTRRVAFNEITKKAITEAFDSPRSIDMSLVDAQQARRAVDRIVGYKLSPLLWRTVGPNLSAGRVQSAALLLVVQREREIRAFRAREFWDISARLATDEEDEFVAVHPVGEKQKFSLDNEAGASELTERVRPGPWTVAAVRKSERTRKPPAPFRTSTLQQAASSKLGFPTWKTMKVAQSLYEGGHITYMRTDSTNISQEAHGDIGRAVKEQFGEHYHRARQFAAKTKGAQEAHEAIRPAAIAKAPGDMGGETSADGLRLYEMVWQRTMASQMADAVYDATSVDVDSRGVTFRATGQILKFDGYLRVYLDKADDEPDDVEGLLPDLSEGQALDLRSLDPEQHFTQPPPRFTEATLVKEMERLGIGRPSTYSPTVQLLSTREYVRSESRRLFPTARGEVVTDLLEAHFPDFVDASFTARMEDELDEIAEGDKQMVPVVRQFFDSFTAHLAEQKDKITRPERPTDKTCPECERPVVEKFGKHGLWFLSCSGWPDCKWSQQLDESGEPLPDPEGTGEPCPRCSSELVAKSGRFGPFVGCSNYPTCKYIKKEPPKETGESCPDCGEPLVERRGRFGPFVGCSNYPKCKYIKKDKKTTARKKTGARKKTTRKPAAKKAPAASSSSGTES
ncbi:MAG: type I DNA topoisomerase, partial [Actinobacteria bacterium]|nr:type I DNA topoisomerase [Actinomycetota bacterium]